MRVSLHKAPTPRAKVLLAHGLVWTVFIFYEIVFSGLINGVFHPLLQYALFYGLNIGAFYTQAGYIMPLQKQQGYWGAVKATLLAAFLLVVYCILATGNIIVVYQFVDNEQIHTPYKFDYVLYLGFLYRAVYFVLLGTGYYYLTNYFRGQAQQARQQAAIEVLEKKLVQAELDFLRAQVNPHLLFNTLAYIQHATKTRPDDADQAIQSLSKLMSYSLDRHHQDSVPLGEEVGYAEEVIRIHRLRYADTLKLEYAKTIENDRVTVPPLTLITLVENLFKHGHPANARIPASIRVFADDRKVVFETANLPRKMGLPLQNHKPSGLASLRERLEISLPRRHALSANMEGELFKTRLEIWKDEA